MDTLNVKSFGFMFINISYFFKKKTVTRTAFYKLYNKEWGGTANILWENIPQQ